MGHRDVYEEFRELVKEKRALGSNGLSDDNCWYVPSRYLVDFLTEERVSEVLSGSKFNENLRRLARRDYLKVFSILVYLSEPHQILEFVRRQVDDSSLPLQSPVWPYATNHQHHSFGDTIRRFYNTQWPFCPLEIPGHTTIVHKRDLHPRHVLPFRIQDCLMLSRRGFGQLYKVEIDDSNVPPDQPKQPNSFALKVLSQDKRQAFDNEVKALAAIATKPSDPIAQYHGSFTQGDTCNILLEHTNGRTLSDFLKETPPPESLEQRMELWESMSTLISGLETVHNTFCRDEQVRADRNVMVGIHADIKPENILWCNQEDDRPGSSYQPRFKITDFGLSRFHPLTPHNRTHSSNTRPTTMSNWLGHHHRQYNSQTATKRDGELKRHLDDVGSDRGGGGGEMEDQNWDIFALGCVFLELIVWFQTGLEGLETFRQNRRDELSKKILKYDDRWPAFHDGYGRLLSTVESTFEGARARLEAAVEYDDKVTRRVLEMLQKEVLVPHAHGKGRVRAKDMLKVFYESDQEETREAKISQSYWSLDSTKNKPGHITRKGEEPLRWGYSVRDSMHGY